MKYLNNLDLAQNQLLNAAIQNLGSDPSSPVEGQIFIHTGTHLMKWYNGTTWIDPLARANHSGTQAWSTLTGTPTDLAGYGITDAATVTNLALKAPLASPALTGTPTAPTASPGTNTTQIATTAYADAIAALKANLASPALTGTPTAPTAAGGTNTTQIATTAFVKTAIDSVIDAAPGALDTLNELAAALGDDAAFSTTVTNSLATKAPLASPALTGTPTAPTPSAADNSTKIATTAYVDSAVAGATGTPAYSVDFGNGSLTSFTITHNLNTRDVFVSVRETSGSYNSCMVDWAATTVNTITITTGVVPTTNQYRVTVRS